MASDWKTRLGMVYSTDPDFKYDTGEEPPTDTPPPAEQDLRVWLDRRQRAGKVVTLIKGCGVGGSAKQGEIVIQGDHRDRVVGILNRAGYRCKKAGS